MYRWLYPVLLAGLPLYGAMDATALLKQYCFNCHGNAASPAGGLSLTKLAAQPSMGAHFQQWEKVAAALEQKRMPPAKLPQPGEADRAQTASWIRAKLSESARVNAGDPGRVTVRRLTSGEYAYTVRDLIGFDLKFDSDFGSDAVGGEGFTNFGDVQFMQDAKLERYLEAAKRIADHAVIGAGRLSFYQDPGKSGFELSAINRIQAIYREHGFRAASGEGGRSFNLDRYGKAFYAAWRFQHRQALGLGAGVTLDQLGAQEGLPPTFLRHVWSIVTQPSSTYPTSEVVSRFQSLPSPAAGQAAKVRAQCEELEKFVVNWPRWLFGAGALAKGGDGDERALVLSDKAIAVKPSHIFKYRWLDRSKKKTTRVYLSVQSANPRATDQAVVIWHNPEVQFRKADRGPSNAPEQPFMTRLDAPTIERLAFGKRPDGGPIEPGDFATTAGATLAIDIARPDDATAGEFTVEATLADGAAGDAVLRCTVADREDLTKGRPPGWVLLGRPDRAGVKTWKAGVLEFAGQLPQNSHGEPTPSDKDPIPAPYDNAIDKPERNFYHTSVKYYRDDQFLVENMLDHSTRVRLDLAWADLYSSFDYHDTILRFVSSRYKLNLQQNVAALTREQIEAMPAEPGQFAQVLRSEFEWMRNAQLTAQPGHIEDALRFAAKAWRRPLSAAEQDKLRSFYTKARETSKLDHTQAVRLLLARVLVSPAFLYRFEQQPLARASAGAKALTDWELASRLSYFLWSSAPDEELSRAARAGELVDPRQLERQTRRMLADPKARRLATEFFGQWLGFYRFDDYRGVDTGRYPEFTDEVKSAMYDEAVSFFEHIIRQDRPVTEMFSADYTFLNAPLAKHYGVKQAVTSKDRVEMVQGVAASQRGGLLRLGAVLTATSAPLRTSPVKRGDWVLRRVLGTPTPPPPADAGSIPADDKAFGGQSVHERLAAHQRNPTCAACHSKIDPLGFPLERYDAVGRWRDQYQDGQPIRDTGATADQTPIAGVDGLLGYLKTQESQVLKTFSQKLLGYALGRTMLVSDQPLIGTLSQSGDTSFSTLIQQIVASRQFRYRREADVATPPAPSVAAQRLNQQGARQ